MKTVYFTPGPSQLYPTVKKHTIDALNQDIGSISHRSRQFQKIHQRTTQNLRKLLDIPQTHHIFFLSSALETMERILQNTVFKYSAHFVNGAFSEKWYQFAIELHKKPQKFEVNLGNRFDFEKITIPRKTELICLTQNETSTGVSLPMQDIYDLHKRFPKPLIALDIVSSAPYPQIDYGKIDIAFFSVQKGFGLPAGLDVLILNERAIEKSRSISKKISIGTYHSFPSLLAMAEKNQTPETPNALFIYILGEVCQDMSKRSMKTIRKETNIKARLIYGFAEKNKHLKPFVKEKQFRSSTTIDLELIDKTSEEIVSTLKRKSLVIGKGYGKLKNNHIRIANFPAHAIRDTKLLVDELELLFSND